MTDRKAIKAGRRSLVALLLLAGLLAGCTLPPPQGAAPLRYRDQVFSSVGVQSNLTYGSAPDSQGNQVTLRLDLYQPAGDTAAKRPAIVWVHGGGFTSGARTDPYIVDLATSYAKLGYVAVSISYRLLASNGCGGSGATSECVAAAIAAKHDAQAAVRWLRANAANLRVDSTRIAIGGASAGGVTALLAGTLSEDVGSSGNPGHPSHVRSVVSLCGGLPNNNTIDAGDAPTVFFHGTADRTVPYSWATANDRGLRAEGVFSTLHSFEGAGHCVPAAQRSFILDQSKYFLYYLMDLGSR